LPSVPISKIAWAPAPQPCVTEAVVQSSWNFDCLAWQKSLTHFTLHCYRIDAWAIRRPWHTFVNALMNSILGRFYTARTQKICFVRLAYGFAKAGE